MGKPDQWPTKREVSEASQKGVGFWKTCSGCHESNEGQPTGPYHQILQCFVGHGCFECGGIGAVWDTTDYAAMSDYLAREPIPPIDPAAIREAALKEAAELCDRYPYVEGVKTAILDMIGEKK